MSCSHWVSVSEPYPSAFNVEFGLYDAYICTLDHMSHPAWLAHLVTCIKHCYFHHVHLFVWLQNSVSFIEQVQPTVTHCAANVLLPRSH